MKFVTLCYKLNYMRLWTDGTDKKKKQKQTSWAQCLDILMFLMWLMVTWSFYNKDKIFKLAKCWGKLLFISGINAFNAIICSIKTNNFHLQYWIKWQYSRTSIKYFAIETFKNNKKGKNSVWFSLKPVLMNKKCKSFRKD